MVISLVLFFGLMVGVYFISGKIIQELYLFPYLLTGKKGSGVNFLSFVLLPGTVIHELSHMILAEIMFVRTGEFSFRPQTDKDGAIHIGSLKFAATDPIRRTLIGLSPLITGLTIIGATFYFYLEKIIMHIGQTQWSAPTIILLFAVCYLLFIISVTMFSSKKDLETAAVPAIVLVVIIAILWLAGFKLTVPQKIIGIIDNICTVLDKALVLVIIFDLLGLYFTKGLNFIAKKLIS